MQIIFKDALRFFLTLCQPKKKKQSYRTNQAERHAHNHRGEDEVKCGDLKHVAARIRVCVDIFVLTGQVQGFGTTILTVSLLG